MTTSNSTNYTQTRNEIIADSLVLLGVYSQGDTIDARDYTFCSNILNKMVKAWEGRGIHLWTCQEGVIFLTADYQKYLVTNSGSDIAGDDPVFTTLTEDGSGTTLTVDSIVGMNISDNIGIKLDANTIQWTTISALPTSTTITIAASLTSSASSGNNVFVFTNRIDRPLEITSARFRNAGGYERPIPVKGRDDYMRIPNKDAPGKANQCFYSPKVASASFYIWPVADDVGDCVRISYLRRIHDFDNSTDTPDLPQEWLEAITYNLSVRIAPSYGISTEKLNPDITLIAQQSLGEMELWDSEQGSLNIVPNYRYDE